MSQFTAELKARLGASSVDELHLLFVQQESEIIRIRKALTGLLGHYVDMVNSGDCGNWNPEEDVEVMAARAALLNATQDNGAHDWPPYAPAQFDQEYQCRRCKQKVIVNPESEGRNCFPEFGCEG